MDLPPKAKPDINQNIRSRVGKGLMYWRPSSYSHSRRLCDHRCRRESRSMKPKVGEGVYISHLHLSYFSFFTTLPTHIRTTFHNLQQHPLRLHSTKKYRSYPHPSKPIIMPQGTDQSHAVGDSIVPQKFQEVLPQKVEEKVPNAIHDTGATGAKSHATGDSAVPKVAQEAVPKKAEEVLPEKVHPTA